MIDSITVDPGQAKIRLDHFLVNKLEKVSREKIKRAIEGEDIIVNNKSTKANYLLKGGDKIDFINFENSVRPLDLVPEKIDLQIIYEDSDLLVINKPAGIVVHPGCNNLHGTIANGLVYHFNELPKKDNNSQRPGLVHRIDKNTSGLLLIAKNEYSMAFLGKQFENHTINRSYIALAWHKIHQNDQIIEKYLIKSSQEKKVLISEDKINAKYAKTYVKVIKHYGFSTLVECNLETGRTHQIRVHLSSIGHPIFGDELYGGQIFPNKNNIPKFENFLKNSYKIMPHQALHAKTLGFIHPTTKEKLFFEQQIPDNFIQLLHKIEKISKN